MKIYIKSMVSNRCKIIVRERLETLGLKYQKVDLGQAEIHDEVTLDQLDRLRDLLIETGLELIEDKKAILIEKIKVVIIKMIHYDNEQNIRKNSNYISEHLNHNYRYLSKIFSQETGKTIERYIIEQKIERVKEFLSYGDLNLTQISFRLNYSSVAHLSFQFKKFTGVTPSTFRQHIDKYRVSIDCL